MSSRWGVLAVLFALFFGPSSFGDEIQQMKSDLIGKVMGGREKCWKFQSLSQIKSLEIKTKNDEGMKQVYTIELQLKDSRVPGVYRAEADVTYQQINGKWMIQVVGLIDQKKVGEAEEKQQCADPVPKADHDADGE